MPREALLYRKLEENRVSCFLCSHHCVISDGNLGICQVRENRSGILYAHSYGKLVAQHVDPIEKKPLYHFLPGSTSFSIAAAGCNFQCGFCQNWQISQIKEARALGLRSEEVKPEEVVRQAKRTGSRSVSYTYTEPTIFFEYAQDVGHMAKREGLYNVFVTNGFMTEEMIHSAQPWLGAANIDLKSFNDAYYRRLCKGRLEPVLKSIELMRKLGIWVEVTTLVVPGENDSEEEFRKIAEFLTGIDPAIPWHISRFYPQYQMDDIGSTPIETLNRAYEIGKESGLRYVYLGNVMGKGSDTECPKCGQVLIERVGFTVRKQKIKEGKCPHCQAEIDGIGL